MGYKDDESEIIIVTRHQESVPLLTRIAEDEGWIEEYEELPVFRYVSPSQVEGKHLITTQIPYHVAANADKVTVITFAVPSDLKGKNMTEDEVSRYYHSHHTYRIEKL